MMYGMKNIGCMSEGEIIEAFATIPQGVTTLGLSGNYLYQKSGAGLAQVFALIPPG